MNIDGNNNGNVITQPHRQNDRGRGRGRGRFHSDRGGYPSGGRRAPFSQAGPNNDRSITTVVVEQIPEEQFDEQSVRDFFSQFGNIVEVTMKAYKRLAMVKYDHYASAKQAYESPKVIFDNRFVKVYWYNPETIPTPPMHPTNGAGIKHPTPVNAPKPDSEMVDAAEFEQQQAEAQKAHEEKARKLREAESKKEELEAKMKAQAEERKRLMEKLTAKTAGNATSLSPTAGQSRCRWGHEWDLHGRCR